MSKILKFCLMLAVTAFSGPLTVRASEWTSWPGNSTYLSETGERAKAFFYSQIERRNLYAQEVRAGVRFVVMDARDPRLYFPGAAIQPPTPAEKVIVKVSESGAFIIMAFILDRPGNLTLKESPTGNLVIQVNYAVNRIEYRSRFDGLFASAHRVTSGYGWNYVYYLRGLGNNVTPGYFENAVGGFLTNAAVYITPF